MIGMPRKEGRASTTVISILPEMRVLDESEETAKPQTETRSWMLNIPVKLSWQVLLSNPLLKTCPALGKEQAEEPRST